MSTKQVLGQGKGFYRYLVWGLLMWQIQQENNGVLSAPSSGKKQKVAAVKEQRKITFFLDASNGFKACKHLIVTGKIKVDCGHRQDM